METHKPESTQQTNPDQTGMSPDEKRGPSRVRDRKDMEKIFKSLGVRTIGQVTYQTHLIIILNCSQIINFYLKQQSMEKLISSNLSSILLLLLLMLRIQYFLDGEGTN